MILKNLINKIEYKYPLNLAYEWDNVGLLVGDFNANIKTVLVVLEVNETVIDEAINNNIDLIITHHPFIFKKMNKINTCDLKGRLIYKLIKNNIALYSMHTNFDIAFDGLNDYFMEIMGFENTSILDVTSNEVLYKLVVYVPEANAKIVKEALGKSGAGNIGNYSYCSFLTKGEGSFKPLEGSEPFIGSQGSISTVKEVKLETIVKQNELNKVVSSMLKVHPYEEVVYDLYKLENSGKSFGLGRVSKLNKTTTLEQLSNFIKEKLNMKYIRIVGEKDSIISKVALVTGSGSDMIKKSKKAGADVLITGDIKYHEAQDALDMGICIIDCGHFETENIFSDVIKRFLDQIDEIEVIKSNVNLNPFNII